MSETIEHKCPCCGASLQFDIGTQSAKCPYCDSEFDIKDTMKNEGDLTEEFVDRDDLAADGGTEWSEAELYGMSEYQCKSCGGDIYSDADTAATICPYCGNAVILKGRLSGVLKPDRVIPFQQTKEVALQGLKDHCGGKRFVPKKFLLNNRLEEIKGLYVPFWVYDADLDADVSYRCTTERTWRSGNTEYTETKYYSVRRGGEIAFDHVPVDGSSKMPDDLMESIEPFDYDKSVDFTTAYLSGYVADKYDHDQDEMRPRAKKRMAEGAADAFQTTVHGYDTVSVEASNISARASNVNYVLYPVWLMTTEWNDTKFVFAMNGQTGKMVGNLPADMLKLGACTAGIFAAIVIAFLLATLLGDPEDYTLLIFGLFIAVIAAIIFYTHFKNQLKSVEFQHGASNYYRENSMNVTQQSDVYLYKHVTTRRINND
jgi:DNA-directed RNA polymerase subunit RPC12/RpoP